MLSFPLTKWDTSDSSWSFFLFLLFLLFHNNRSENQLARSTHYVIIEGNMSVRVRVYLSEGSPREPSMDSDHLTRAEMQWRSYSKEEIRIRAQHFMLLNELFFVSPASSIWVYWLLHPKKTFPPAKFRRADIPITKTTSNIVWSNARRCAMELTYAGCSQHSSAE